ncbi:JM150 [macacine gammaherpesvirus 11]|uniref:JM150 n=2 Tax=macacine gammaherpesvirus 11 TaxID=2560570 RepID=G9JMX7_9GAMA|nr:JM150 [Macaca fuscata rhadinovirus]AAT00127.1 JM150 [Macaca fuscata rhadinovirus]AEW87674.1 JM150 [Macaca fuscata rhadinovirus]AEW87844.1 JM150 [Macaca fuscata rhadinovirus]
MSCEHFPPGYNGQESAGKTSTGLPVGEREARRYAACVSEVAPMGRMTTPATRRAAGADISQNRPRRQAARLPPPTTLILAFKLLFKARLFVARA